MRWLLVPCLLLALVVAPATASAFKVWCPIDGWRARFLVNDIGSASVLYVKGQPPNHWPQQERIIEGITDDPLDLRGRDAWIVEGHHFRLCLNQELPGWVKTVYLPSEVGIPRATFP